MRILKIFTILLIVPLAGQAVVHQDKTPILAKDSIHDDAIVVPESLESDIDSLLTDWFLQTRSYVDPHCVSCNVVPEFSESVYISRLSRLPNLIEMPYNQIVQNYIDLYAKKRRSLVEYMLGLSAFYFPIFEEQLEKEGMPQELKYLSIIESALKPGAVSRAGATGLWQIMPATAKGLGLEINSLVDERCDPIKSTKAAVRYLKDLYGIYQDWNLAIAAYNCGPGNVNKAIKRADGKKDYWDIYYYLPKETRGYVPAFIAANYIMNYYQEHNLCPMLTDMPMSSDTVRVKDQIHFRQIADVLQIPMDQLRQLNPQYRRDIIPGHIKMHTLRLPMLQICSFIESKDSILAYKSGTLINRRTVEPYTPEGNSAATRGTATYHKVRPGETLSTIAQKHRVSVTNLKNWNHLRNSNIRAGQKLALYGSKVVVEKTQKVAVSTPTISSVATTGFAYHTVRKGENLWSISQQFPGVTSEQIMQCNGMSDNSLKIGQVLKIPKG